MNSFGFMGEDSVIEGIRARNTSKLSKIEADIMDAKENLGEEEVRQAMFAKATLLAESGDTKEAIAVFDEIEQQKKTTTGQKVDVSFSKLRIAFSTDDLPLMSKTIEKAKEYVEVGGDWERRNRLKVYEAVFFTRTRHFSQAAHMFLESVATFTAVELFEYPRFIKYAVATAVVALDRSTLKSKVIDSPEVIAVIHEVPPSATPRCIAPNQ
jgi:26S proteasome regulatory subunit N7